MKKIILTIAVFAVAANGFSQLQRVEQPEREIANKAIYAELGGAGVIMSFNFDTRFSNSNRGWGMRAGVGFGIADFTAGQTIDWIDSNGIPYYSDYTEKHSYYSFPIQVTYIFGRRNSRHAFEVGGGVTPLTRKVSLYTYDSNHPGHFIGHMCFMYRIAPAKGGFLFRVGLTPIIGTGGDLYPMAAVSFGFTF